MKNKKKAVQILIEKAFESMRENHRLKDISVVELCKEANVSHASFYHYYEDIYDLNRKMEKAEFLSVMKKLENIENEDKKRYALFIDSMIDFVRKHYLHYKPEESYILFRNLEYLFSEIFSDLGKEKQLNSNMTRYTIISYIAIVSQMAKAGENSFTEENIIYLEELWKTMIEFAIRKLYPNVSEEERLRLRKESQVVFFQNIEELSASL